MTSPIPSATSDFRRLSIGPVRIGPHSVRLRPPQVGDAQRWQALRLRDRTLIEPFWIAADLDWGERHSESSWIREVLVARRTARARDTLPLVIEVDGRFCGQCNLTAIDQQAREAEIGIWVEADVAGLGVSTLAAGLIADYGFEVLGLRRIIAPVAADNRRALTALGAARFRREATLPAFALTGGGRLVDHELWALTPDALPVDGLVGLARRRADPDAVPVPISDVCVMNSRMSARVVPSTMTEIRAVGRFHIGSLRRRWRNLMPMRVPERSITTSNRVRGLRLRQIRLFDALRPRPRSGTSDPVITPLRRGSWFAATDPAVAFHITLGDNVIGRAELIGVNAAHGIAEAVVRVDRDVAGVDVTGEATRLLLGLGQGPLHIRRITGATGATDDFAAAVAVHAGLHHQGRLADTAIRDGVVGDIDLWATELVTDE